MATSAQKGRRRSSMAKRKRSSGWLRFLPVIVGVLLTPWALRSASVMALFGPGAMAVLFPWAELVQGPLPRMPAPLAGLVGQYLMYLQFPVYGFLMFWIMRKRAFGAALLAVVLLHAGGGIATFSVDHMQTAHMGY